MAVFKVEVGGLAWLMRSLDRYSERAEDAVWLGLERTAFEVKDHAALAAPKVTSSLARSIQITGRDREALRLAVSTNLEYARAIEFGFSGVVQAHTRQQTHAWGRRLDTPVLAHVRAHYRFSTPQPYMQPAAQYGQRRVRQNVESELNALEL